MYKFTVWYRVYGHIQLELNTHIQCNSVIIMRACVLRTHFLVSLYSFFHFFVCLFIITASPVFTKDTIDKQFGELSKAVEIYVNVYSVPKFNSFEWSREGNLITTKYQTSSSPTIVKDNFHDKEVQLNGFNVTLTIPYLTAEDIANYTVTLKGRLTGVMHTVILESASKYV